MRRQPLLIATCWTCAWAAGNDQISGLKTKVEPDWGSLTSGYLVEQVRVGLAVRASGEPFSLVVKSGSVPDPVVRALAQWRFSPLKNGGRNSGFLINLRVPVRRKLDPEREQSQRPVWRPPAELLGAIKVGNELDAKKAAEMQANLPIGEALGNFRASLLTYYAQKGASDAETARKARRDLIPWLIRTFPQDSILASRYAIINASGEPLADHEGSALEKKEWLAAMKQYPKDNAVAEGAVNFLRVADPTSALRIVAERVNWSSRSNWLGNLYALAGLGVNALAPDSGAAIATVSPKLSEEGLAASFRKAMLESRDLKVVLSGLATTAALARNLAGRNALPDGYAEFCKALMNHTRELYPQTSLNCSLPTANTKTAASTLTQSIGSGTAAANLTKKVQPSYPKEAKKRHMEGAVEFTALIGTDGHIHELDLVRAPFVFYQESYNAVLQWEYRPFRSNGSAVPVITDIVVNYTLE